MIDPVLFGFGLFDTGALLFLLVFFVITLSDLECDYLNAQECCNKLNFWTWPKFLAHVILTGALLFTGHWALFLMNLPFVSWLGYELLALPYGNMGIYDPMEIYNRGMIKRHLRDCMIYLGFYLTMFFVYMYCMLNALLKDDPIRRHEEHDISEEF